jgi:hypothetical protein
LALFTKKKKKIITIKNGFNKQLIIQNASLS